MECFIVLRIVSKTFAAFSILCFSNFQNLCKKNSRNLTNSQAIQHTFPELIVIMTEILFKIPPILIDYWMFLSISESISIFSSSRYSYPNWHRITLNTFLLVHVHQQCFRLFVHCRLCDVKHKLNKRSMTIGIRRPDVPHKMSTL